MFYRKRTIRTTSIPKKLGRFIAAFGSYTSKTLKTVIFCQKWRNFRLKWPKFRQIRIPVNPTCTRPFFSFGKPKEGSILPFLRKRTVFGLSALAVEAYGFTLVCSSVRPSVRSSVTRYLEIRASDFSETLPKVASWRD